MHLDPDIVTALEKAAAEEEKARQKGAARKDKAGRTPKTTQSGKSDAVSDAGTNSG